MSCTRSFHKQNLSCSQSQSLGWMRSANQSLLTYINSHPEDSSESDRNRQKQKTSPSTFNKKLTHPSLQGWVKPLYHAGCFTPQKPRDGSIDVLVNAEVYDLVLGDEHEEEWSPVKAGQSLGRSWFLSWGGFLISCWSKKAPTVGLIEQTPKKPEYLIARGLVHNIAI